jgi:hypothetical protein
MDIVKMKIKNKLLKTSLTVIFLSVASVANADDHVGPVTIFTEPLKSHAVISGGALNIAADSVVDGNLAAQAAVTIGAGLDTQTQNIYAGAAVTTGALSTVKNIFSGAAASIGASAHAQNVHAGAAITVGAGGDVQQVYAGAAITLGAGASTDSEVLGATANTDSNAAEDIHNATSMATAIAQIGIAQDALSTLSGSTTNPPESLYTTMGGLISLEPGVHQGSAVSIAANSVVTFSANNTPGEATDHVWVINLTEALTVGAGTVFETDVDVDEDDTATIIWNVGAAVTLGAGTQFLGTAFVDGAFNAATSDVSCGNIYATGAVSVGSIGALDIESIPEVCDTNAKAVDALTIDDGALTITFDSPSLACPVSKRYKLEELIASITVDDREVDDASIHVSGIITEESNVVLSMYQTNDGDSLEFGWAFSVEFGGEGPAVTAHFEGQEAYAACRQILIDIPFPLGD